MSSDWQYIQDEMGGWNEETGLPNFCDEDGFYDDGEVVHVSECCGAYVRHPESDICSECFEHCEVLTEEEYYN